MLPKIFSKLKDPEYRKAFVASQINIAIPFQIRGLLKSRGWKQGDLANRTGMLQPRISALLTPGKVRPNINTLRRIAEAFDCGLQVRFVPFSELAFLSEDFDPENFSIPTFDEEFRQAEEREKKRESTIVAVRNPPTKINVASAVVGFSAPLHGLDKYFATTAVEPRFSKAKEVYRFELRPMPSALTTASQSAKAIWSIQTGEKYVTT